MTTPKRLPLHLLGIATFALACFRILSFGYLPPDDVLRHAAFATTHRNWGQILVGRPEALFDQSPGWHAFLRILHACTGWDPETLALVSIALCLMLFLSIGLLWVRHWEAWALTLAAFFLVDGALIQRLSLGRPFIVTAAITLCLLGSVRTPGLQPWRSWRHLGWLLGGALATWVHGSWYLLLLIPGAVLLAGRWLEALRLGAALLAGCLLGALLTGHPASFLGGQLAHLGAALGQPSQLNALAMEFLPGLQPLLLLPFIGLAALWNHARPKSLGLQQDATFILGVLAWIVGYFWVWRFYLDWAFPALALWTAWQLDDALEEAQPVGWSRAQLSAFTMLCFVAVAGANLSERWSVIGSGSGLDARRPAEAALLPEPGGVLYATSMRVFYATFFHNPEGQWKYVLGYEPGMMTPEDAAVYQAFFSAPDKAQALAPWIARMGAGDRLVLEAPAGHPPRIPTLVWSYAEPNKWVGRKPPSSTGPRPAGGLLPESR